MSTSTVPSVTATIEQLKKDGLEFYLNSRLEPTVRIPNDAFQKEWPVDSQRVQDLLVAVHYDISDGGILRSLERDFLLAQLREECRNGGRRFSEFESIETDKDVIVQAIVCHMNKEAVFEGRTVDLLQRLRKLQAEGNISLTEEIPVFTNIFSRRLSRLVPVLKGYGIEVTLDHKEDGTGMFPAYGSPESSDVVHGGSSLVLRRNVSGLPRSPWLQVSRFGNHKTGSRKRLRSSHAGGWDNCRGFDKDAVKSILAFIRANAQV